MIMNVLIVSIVGGILCLDRIFVQVLISRPIVAAPVIGAAVALNTINLRGTLPIFCAVFLIMTVILHYIRYV